jgi:hypothetical protein
VKVLELSPLADRRATGTRTWQARSRRTGPGGLLDWLDSTGKGKTSMTDDPGSRTGRCLCGDVRFAAKGTPALTEFCHCGTCRRATGAPLAAFAGFPVGRFRVTQGEPARFASSPEVIRTFCGRCGTSLTIFSERFPDDIYVAVAAFDDPETLAPEVHIWTSERLSWLETADVLPRHASFRADDG